MRLKKGFTLAEILIVLMVIGVIATMTIPSMMKGVAESQLKAGYKKAYNTIANFAAMERVAGSLPSQNSDAGVAGLYLALNNSLSVKGYAIQNAHAHSVLLSSSTNYPTALRSTVTGADFTIGTGTPTNIRISTDAGVNAANNLAWIITEDNLAYAVVRSTLASGTCLTKQEIAAQQTDVLASSNSCAVVYVDVNGMSKGPNEFEEQSISAALTSDTQALNTITGDRYKIYLGKDGATPGHRTRLVTGRIASDLK